MSFNCGRGIVFLLIYTRAPRCAWPPLFIKGSAMKWFSNLRIAKKLLLSFLCVLLLTAILGIFSIAQLNKVNNASTEIATNWLPSIRTLADIKLLLARVRSTESQMAIYEGDSVAMEALFKRSQTILSQLDVAIKIYESQISEPAEKALYPEVKKGNTDFLAEHAKIMVAFLAKNNGEARRLFLGQSNKLYADLLVNLENLAKVNIEGSDASTKGADATFASGRSWIIGMLIAALVMGLTLALYVARIIAAPLGIAVSVAKQVAEGDLTADIRPASEDETGQLMASLKAMNDSLLRIVGQVRSGTDTIATASSEIASGNLDLSSRTEEQASSLEETASA